MAKSRHRFRVILLLPISVFRFLFNLGAIGLSSPAPHLSIPFIASFLFTPTNQTEGGAGAPRHLCAFTEHFLSCAVCEQRVPRAALRTLYPITGDP
jgi:hypothetical protein